MSTNAEKRRFLRLQELGCICCHIEGLGYVPAEIDHIVDKGYRRLSGGHAATIPLCPYHHRGVPPSGFSEDTARGYAGPSKRLHRKLFIKTYGTDRELLAVVNKRIEALEKAA